MYLDTVELYDAQLDAWRELDLCATDPSCFKRAFFCGSGKGLKGLEKVSARYVDVESRAWPFSLNAYARSMMHRHAAGAHTISLETTARPAWNRCKRLALKNGSNIALMCERQTPEPSVSYRHFMSGVAIV